MMKGVTRMTMVMVMVVVVMVIMVLIGEAVKNYLADFPPPPCHTPAMR